MVRPMSAASAPISMARPTSAISSPALGPTMPPPMTRLVAASTISLVNAFVAAQRQRTAAGRPGKRALANTEAVALGLAFGDTHPGHFRIGVGHRGNDARIEGRLVAGGDFRRHLGLVHGLVRQHGLADDVADGEDVRHVGAHLLVDGNEAALVDRDARGLGIDAACRWARGPRPPARGRIRIRCVLPPASKVTVMPSGNASTFVTLVPSRICS